MKISAILCLLFLFNFFAIEANTVKSNQPELWYETFGETSSPPLLLIMGGGGQGIIRPTEFCERLAQRGFYVICYDQRDSGYRDA
ncbi:MAG: hypothetical protein LLG04_05580 [Parachlamydia sp.]|nr:hypothetical protein [Parachlamydia sp.]